MKIGQHVTLMSGLALGLTLASPFAWADQQVVQNFALPMQLQGTVTATDCSNAPGPQITFNGSVVMSGLGVQFIFNNNKNFDVHTATATVTENVTAIPPGDTIVIPKQPVDGGVGGNPFIWAQIVDGNDNPITAPVFLGRCVQGDFNGFASFDAPVIGVADVAILSCSNAPGPFVNLSGDMDFPNGLKIRFLFANSDNKVGGPHEAEATVDEMLLPAGFSITIPKQPVDGGTGGNPWISVQFMDGSGNLVGNQVLLGHCVQLGG